MMHSLSLRSETSRLFALFWRISGLDMLVSEVVSVERLLGYLFHLSFDNLHKSLNDIIFFFCPQLIALIKDNPEG